MKRSSLSLFAAVSCLVPSIAEAQTDATEYVGYFYWEEGATTELTLLRSHSASEVPQVVSPVLHLGRGVSVELDPVLILPGKQAKLDLGAELRSLNHTSATVDPLLGALETWGTGYREMSAWGSIELRNADDIVAAVCTTDPGESLSADGGLVRQASDHAQGAWWLPTPSSRVLVPLSNVGEEEITVLSSILGSDSWVSSQHTVNVPAGRTRLVALDQLFDLSQLGVRAGSVSFQVEGGQQSLNVSTLTVDDSTGLSVTQDLVFELQGVPEWNSGTFPMGPLDPVMGFPTGIDFAGKLVLSNGVQERSSVSLTLRAEGVPNPLLNARTKVVSLSAFETELIDLRSLFGGESANPFQAPRGYTLEIAGRGIRNVQATLWTVNEGVGSKYDYAFFYPLQPQARRADFFVVPALDLSEGKTTQFSLRNTAKQEETISFAVFDADGSIVYESAQVFEAEGFKLVDLGVLRDSGVPDMHGNVLPANFTGGYIVVSGGAGKLGYNAVIDANEGTCLMGHCLIEDNIMG